MAGDSSKMKHLGQFSPRIVQSDIRSSPKGQRPFIINYITSEILIHCFVLIPRSVDGQSPPIIVHCWTCTSDKKYFFIKPVFIKKIIFIKKIFFWKKFFAKRRLKSKQQKFVIWSIYIISPLPGQKNFFFWQKIKIYFLFFF
jgi:hypothetical protein